MKNTHILPTIQAPWPSRSQTHTFYNMLASRAEALGPGQLLGMHRELCKTDLFYLMVHGLNVKVADRDWIYERCREVQNNPNGYLDLWARGHFKALALDTPVFTPSGWTTHGELRPGDKVFGPDGIPTTVVAKTPVFVKGDCFEVEFCDGEKITAHADHLWTVDLPSRKRITGSGARKKWQTATIPTHALAWEVEKSNTTKSRPFPKIPVAKPLTFPPQNLPIHPYVLGVWLGNGHASGARVTMGPDDVKEMVEHLLETGVTVEECNYGEGLIRLGTGKVHQRGSSDFLNALDEMNLRNNKHIPPDYLIASESQRLELLQGLMDTDGSCHIEHGQCVFCNTNEALAKGALELCQGLGLKATIRSQVMRVNDAPYTFYQVQFRGFAERPVFKMRRKRASLRPFAGVAPHRKVVAVRKCKSVNVSCIQVAREDGLYLVGSGHVQTHNSTIITFALTIMNILNDPSVTIGIFSHTRPIAKQFLRQIKLELEGNTRLKQAFPDILFSEPSRQSPKWSEDEGIIVKRPSNPKEATVEAWGLVDSQPVSKHFNILVFDDCVVEGSVTSPEMMMKVEKAWELALNLTSEKPILRHIGTRYHFADLYRTIMDRGAATPRLYPATHNGALDGEPVLLDRETLMKKRREMGPYTFSAQMLQNPVADDIAGFKREWVRYYEPGMGWKNMRIHIVVDPASSKKRYSDYTVIMALGLSADQNIYVLDMVRDRLNLTERWKALYDMHRKFNVAGRPLPPVGYEKYGMQADIEYIKESQKREGYRFDVIELGGTMPKVDRIRRLIPEFEQGRIYLPEALMRNNYEGRLVDVVQQFVEEELTAFPVGGHDDMLDAMSRIKDEALGARPPQRAGSGALAGSSPQRRRPIHIGARG